MIKSYIILFAIALSIVNEGVGLAAAPLKTSLSGKITNKTSGEILTGAAVYVPDLKTGAVSGPDGTYKLDNLPQSKILVKVSLLGYKTIVQTIDLASVTVYDFTLEESNIDINEVVITGTSRSTEIRQNPVPMAVIDRKEIDQNLNTNVIDAIAKLPGVNAVTTGPNVSKPFIRGLGYNRILTLFDGMRQEGQQWGDEHGIEVDENSVDRIEVVKGPASLIYGSDALAGVVNLLPPPTVPDGEMRGSVRTNYMTNNGLYGVSADLAGNKNGLVWMGRFSHKEATNYQNKYDGRVYGTGFHETDANGYLGLNRHWGYSHLNFSVFDALQQIPDGSRDSLSRKFTKRISEADTIRPVVSDEELNSYKIPVIHQHVQHFRLYSNNNFIFGKSKLGVIFGYQQSMRREFSHPLFAEIPGLYLFLQTYSYDFKYYLPEWNGWETTIGLNGMYQTNTNKGTEFIIPDYSLFDIGPFAFVKKAFQKLDVSAGIRYDQRSFKNTDMYIAPDPSTGFDMQAAASNAGASHPFSAYQHVFSGVSGSIGATYNFSSNFLMKTNVARGFRSPNIAEISANGVHPGTNIYQIGNSNFLPEFSLQEDIGLFFSSKHISGSIELFNNDIQNYIYNQKLLNRQGADSIIVPGNQTFQFQAAHAQLYGGEFSMDIHPHPLDWLHFENSVSVIYTLNKGVNGIPVPDSAKYLPFIPPLHTNSELRADIGKWKCFSSLYIKIGAEYYAAQDKAYLAYNTETTTPAYTLINAGIGADVNTKAGKKLFSVHITGSNLMDVAYQSHLSRLKYFESYPVNGTGRSGIYNMGRNIGIKLTIPLAFKKASS